ncbi:MAG: hypothetical protein M9887_00825 [Chitinophagales bacterium]|nr:hypothetical protein [Chitinophagales bacterium]
MKKIYWKVSGVNNLPDARFLNALDDAWIEFVFDGENERYISVEQANAISEWLFEPKLLAAFGLHQSEKYIFDTMKETFSQFASISIEHDLIQDENFLPLAFVRLDNHQIDKALLLNQKPYAFIIKSEHGFSERDLLKVQNLQKNSKVFLSLPENINTFKKKISMFDEIGIELPAIDEQSAGCGAVDAYSEIMESIES